MHVGKPDDRGGGRNWWERDDKDAKGSDKWWERDDRNDKKWSSSGDDQKWAQQDQKWATQDDKKWSSRGRHTCAVTATSQLQC